ncbi:hypothetical protein VNO77_02074 [Canavalia gladiata]|uniref:Uncharacterized protein n=1 Tax=Canavalia gladiata TaxID=3824 RepID=A0AAN9MYQ6_CANGL
MVFSYIYDAHRNEVQHAESKSRHIRREFHSRANLVIHSMSTFVQEGTGGWECTKSPYKEITNVVHYTYCVIMDVEGTTNWI